MVSGSVITNRSRYPASGSAASSSSARASARSPMGPTLAAVPGDVAKSRLRYRWSVVWFLWRLGALSLSITQTVLVFVGVPAVVMAAVYGLVYGSTARRSSKRYRPGRPFTFAPVWFLAAPDQ